MSDVDHERQRIDDGSPQAAAEIEEKILWWDTGVRRWCTSTTRWTVIRDSAVRLFRITLAVLGTANSKRDEAKHIFIDLGLRATCFEKLESNKTTWQMEF